VAAAERNPRRPSLTEPAGPQAGPYARNGTMDALIYVANGLYLLSYLVRDILHLRLLTITAIVCLALYFASRPEPLMEVVYWNLLFLALNVFQIGWILRSRRHLPGETADTGAGTAAGPAGA
jgi:hypothetical protein